MINFDTLEFTPTEQPPEWWDRLCSDMAGGAHQYDHWSQVPAWTIAKYLQEGEPGK